MEPTIARRAGDPEVVQVPRGIVHERMAAFSGADKASSSTSRDYCTPPQHKTNGRDKVADIETIRVRAPAQIVRSYPDEVTETHRRVTITRQTITPSGSTQVTLNDPDWPLSKSPLSNRQYPVVSVNVHEQQPVEKYEPMTVVIPVQRTYTSTPVRPNTSSAMMAPRRGSAYDNRRESTIDSEYSEKENELIEAKRMISKLCNDLERLETDKQRLLALAAVSDNSSVGSCDESTTSTRAQELGERQKIIEECGRIMQDIKNSQKEMERSGMGVERPEFGRVLPMKQDGQQGSSALEPIGDSSKILSIKDQKVMFSTGPSNKQEELIQRLQHELTDAQQCNHRLNAQLGTLAAGSTATLKREILDMKKDLRDRQNEVEQLKKKIQKFEKDKQQWDTQKKQLESKLPVDVQQLMAQKRELTMQLDREQNEKHELFLQMNSMIGQLAESGDAKKLEEENRSLQEELRDLKKKSASHAAEEIQRVKDEMDVRQRMLEADKKRLEAEAESAQKELQMKSAALQSLMLAKQDTGKMDKLSEDNKLLEDQVKTLEKSLADYRLQTENNSVSSSTHDALKEQLKDAQEQLYDLEKRIDQESILKESLKLQLAGAEAKITDYQRKIDEAQKDLEAVHAQKNQAGSSHSEVLTQLEAQITDLKKKNDGLSLELDELRESERVQQVKINETCAKFDASRVSLLAAESRAAQAEADLKAMETQMQAAERKSSQLQSQLEAAGDESKEVHLLRDELKKAEDRYNTVSSRLQKAEATAQEEAATLRRELENLTEQLNSAQKSRSELESSSSLRSAELQTTVENLRKELEQMKVDKQKLESKASVADEINTLMSSLTALRAENSQYQQETTSLHEKINALTEELEQTQEDAQEWRSRAESSHNEKEEVSRQLNEHIAHASEQAEFERSERAALLESEQHKHEHSMKALHEQLNVLQSTVEEHDRVQQKVKDETAELKKENDKLKHEVESLKINNKNYEEIITAKNAEIELLSQEITSIKDKEIRLHEDIQRAAQESMGEIGVMQLEMAKIKADNEEHVRVNATLKEEVSRHEQQATRLLDELQAQTSRSDEKVKELKKEIDDLSQNNIALKVEVEELKQDHELMKASTSRLENDLQKSSTQSSEEIENLKTEKTKIREENIELRSELDALRQAKSTLEAEKREAVEQSESLRVGQEAAIAENKKLEEKTSDLVKELQYAKEAQQRLREDIERHNAQKSGEVGELQNEASRLREGNIQLSNELEALRDVNDKLEQTVKLAQEKHEKERKEHVEQNQQHQKIVTDLQAAKTALESQLALRAEEHNSSIEEIKIKSERLSNELDSTKQELVKAREDIVRVSKLEESLRLAQEVHQKEKDQSTEENEQHQKQFVEFQAINAALETKLALKEQEHSSTLNELQEKLEVVEKLLEETKQKLNSNTEQHSQAISNLEEQLAATKVELSESETRAKQLDEKLVTLQAETDKLIQSKEHLAKQLSDVQSEYDEVKTSLHSAQTTADKMRDAESFATKIRQQLQELEQEKAALIEQHEEEKNQLEKQIGDVQSDSAAKIAQLCKEHCDKIKELKSINDEVSNQSQSSVADLQSTKEKLEEELSRLKSKGERQAEELAGLKKLQEVASENHSTAFKELQIAKDALEVEIARLISEKKAQRQELIQKHDQAEIQNSALEQEIETLRKQKQEAELQLRLLNEKEEERTKMEKKVTDLEAKLAASTKSQSELLANVRGLTQLLETESQRVEEIATEKKKWKDKAEELEHQIDDLKNAGPDENTSELIAENARLAGELLKARSQNERTLDEERQQHAKNTEDRMINVNKEKERITADLAAAKSRIEELNRTIVQTEKKRKEEVASIYGEMDIVKKENSRLLDKIEQLSSNGHPVAPPRRVSNMSAITNFTTADFSEIDDVEILRKEIDKQRRLIIVLRRKLQAMQ